MLANTTILARRALERSLRWLQGASRALEDKRWDDCVFSSQMAVELSSKSVLLSFGIEFPKRHDVSTMFRTLENRSEVPSWFSSRVEELARNISELAEVRSIAGYAYEQDVTPDYFKEFAKEAYKNAKRHVAMCGKFLKERLRKQVKVISQN